MTRFEYFDEGYATVGLQLGVVSVYDVTKFVRYKVYLEFCLQFEKSTAIELSAERCRCSDRAIYRAIDFFDKTLSK